MQSKAASVEDYLSERNQSQTINFSELLHVETNEIIIDLIELIFVIYEF